ncbi:hypothetical protein ACEUDK_20005 [Aeromonas veronii]
MTSKTIKLKGFYGKSGNTIFLIIYKNEILSNHKDKLPDITDLYVSNSFFICKLIRNGDGTDWVLLQHPFYTIHKSKHIGSLSFL